MWVKIGTIIENPHRFSDAAPWLEFVVNGRQDASCEKEDVERLTESVRQAKELK